MKTEEIIKVFYEEFKARKFTSANKGFICGMGSAMIALLETIHKTKNLEEVENQLINAYMFVREEAGRLDEEEEND